MDNEADPMTAHQMVGENAVILLSYPRAMLASLLALLETWARPCEPLEAT